MGSDAHWRKIYLLVKSLQQPSAKKMPTINQKIAPKKRKLKALQGTTPPSIEPPVASGAPHQPSAARLRKEKRILETAEHHFAQYGLEGASLEAIAQDAGLSRHNLLYYFPSKEALYQRVLHDVLQQWLSGMSNFLQGDDPPAALRNYIRAKLQSSREHPNGSKVFTREVMAGAPRFGTTMAAMITPVLAADVQVFERWVAQGRIAAVDFTHLMFILWSVTQAYADQQAQFALLLGRPALLREDYDAAAELIARLVIRGLSPEVSILNSSG